MISRSSRFVPLAWFALTSLVTLASVHTSTKTSYADMLYVSLANGNIDSFNTLAASPSPTVLASGLTSPAGLTLSSSGNLIAATGTTITQITPGGTVSSYASGLTSAQSVAFSGGNLFAIDYGSSGSGSLDQITFGSSVPSQYLYTLSGPVGLAADTSGYLYVANKLGGTIEKIGTGSMFGESSTFASGLSGPTDLAFNSSGDLYVSVSNGGGTGAGGILEYSSAGVLISTVVSSGLTNPNGMAFDSQGNLYVANSDGTIDKVTAGGTVSVFASGLGSGAIGMAIVPNSVPEPSSVLLMGSGLSLALLAYRRRNKNSRNAAGV